MSDWAKKRFWKDATVENEDGAFTVRLDGRPLKTPAKSNLIVPTEAMARAIAQEWQAQGAKINPESMPTTRSANAAIDKVAVQHAAVADMLAEYGGTDLLCYRADAPAELVARQAAAWDPLLDWAAETLDARLISVCGVMHIAQDSGALDRLRAQVHALTPFELAAFHDLVSLSGSLVLGFATMHNFRPADEIWTLSRIDETWQEDQWGADEEATAMAETKFNAFIHADRFFKMSRI